ncbi:MAG: PEGA domain-containing protein [Candidatus Delongbacteria bacterium]|nr:PEGA domain-containing protein [Candidatus Delongbacteria bacterium]
MKKIIIFLILTMIIAIKAADFKIISFEKNPMDLTARKNSSKLLDVNGNECALIKVMTDLTEISFESTLLEKSKLAQEGEYWIYLQKNTKRVKFNKEGVIPFTYEFPEKLEESTVYILKLTAEGLEQKIEDIAISIITDPEQANIIFDGENKGNAKQINTSIGPHEITVEKNGYFSHTGQIEVSASKTLFEFKLKKTDDNTDDLINVYIKDINTSGGVTQQEKQNYKNAISNWLVKEPRFSVTNNIGDAKKIIEGYINQDSEYRYATVKLIDPSNGNIIKQSSDKHLKVWKDDIRSFDDFIFYTCHTVMDNVLPKPPPKAPSLSKEISGIEFGEFTDPRDNSVYKTVKIGDQTWFAENLRYKDVKGVVKGTGLNSPKQNGLYYNYEGAQEACPPGWHIPSIEEVEELLEYLNDEYGPMSRVFLTKYLRSKDRWEENMSLGDPFGFNIVPAGWYQWGNFKWLNEAGAFWVSDKISSFFSKDYYIMDTGKYTTGGIGKVEVSTFDKKVDKFYVTARCVKDK